VIRATAIAALLLLTAACGGGTTTTAGRSSTELPSLVHVFSASAATAGGGTIVVTMAVHNAASTADRLLSVTCTCSGTAAIVRPSGSGTVPVKAVALPSNEVVLMGPHGPHVVLSGVSPAPPAGSTLTLQLHFAHASPATTVMVVDGS